MDVVFYLEVFYSFGERQQALSLERQVREAGYRTLLVAAERIAGDVAQHGAAVAAFATPEAGVEQVRRSAPRLVIGCELFNLTPASAHGLIDTGVALATIDGTTLGARLHADPFGVPGFERRLVLPERYLTFRPCPASDVEDDSDTVFHWQAYPGASRLAKEPSAYRALGLSASRKTVLLPLAVWATHFAEEAAPPFDAFHGYHERLVDQVADGLAAGGEEVDLVVVALKSAAAEPRGAVTVHRPGLLPYADYEHLLHSCDLVVSDNIVQASLSKAFVMGTPQLAIEIPAAADMPYRSNIVPLKACFPADRQFARAVETATFGDPAGLRQKLPALLRQGWSDPVRRERRLSYLERAACVAPPGEILRRVIGPPRSL